MATVELVAAAVGAVHQMIAMTAELLAEAVGALGMAELLAATAEVAPHQFRLQLQRTSTLPQVLARPTLHCAASAPPRSGHTACTHLVGNYRDTAVQ